MSVCMLQEPLLPTPTNINSIHLPADEILNFIRVQQWLQEQLNIQHPLLAGIFVLVPGAALQQQLLPEFQQQLQATCSSSSNDLIAAVAPAIPWRLCQVSGVEVPSGVDPADATVLLVGGDRVAARDVKQGGLVEVQDYQVGAAWSALPSSAVRMLSCYANGHAVRFGIRQLAW